MRKRMDSHFRFNNSNFSFLPPNLRLLAIIWCCCITPPLAEAIVCLKDHTNQLGFNDFRAINVDCGPYIQHCIKVRADDGQIIRGCDQVSLCPKDGTKLIYHADYYCCATDLCNGAEGTGRRSIPGLLRSASALPLSLFTLLIILALSASLGIAQRWHL